MARPNKLVKYGLDKEVYRLKEKEGKTLEEIAEHIRNNHSDIDELRNISHMAVKRCLDEINTEEMESAINQGVALAKIEGEFNDKVRSLLGDAEELKTKTDEILKDALDKNADYGDLVKIIQAQNKNFDQIRKGIIALREYSDRHFVRPIQNIQIKQENHINNLKLEYQNLLLGLAHKLCPNCRKIIGDELQKILKNDDDEIIDI